MTARKMAARAVLKSSPLFGQVDERLLDDMLEHFHFERWPKKRSIALERISGNFHIIISGRVRIERINPESGRTLTLFLLAPGDAFDLLQLLTNKPGEGEAVAVDDLELLSASTCQVREWISAHPRFNLCFLPYIGRQMRNLADLGADLALHDTEYRLARLIIRHIDRRDDGSFHIRLINDLSHETLASMIGSVRAVVNRQLQHWRQQGIVRLDRGHIHIERLDRLLGRIRDLPHALKNPRH